MASDGAIQHLRDAGQIQHLLEALRQSGHVNLYLEQTDSAAWPVRVLAIQAGEAQGLIAPRDYGLEPA